MVEAWKLVRSNSRDFETVYTINCRVHDEELCVFQEAKEGSNELQLAPSWTIPNCWKLEKKCDCVGSHGTLIPVCTCL